jgi:hypothetical protein
MKEKIAISLVQIGGVYYLILGIHYPGRVKLYLALKDQAHKNYTATFDFEDPKQSHLKKSK